MNLYQGRNHKRANDNKEQVNLCGY